MNPPGATVAAGGLGTEDPASETPITLTRTGIPSAPPSTTRCGCGRVPATTPSAPTSYSTTFVGIPSTLDTARH